MRIAFSVSQRVLIGLGSLFLPCGCTVGPNFIRPEIPELQEKAKSPYFDPVQIPIQKDWWKQFHPSKIDPVIQAAIKNNASLLGAQSTLHQSESLLRAGSGIFYPQVNLSASASRQRPLPFSTGSSGPSSYLSLFTLSGTLSYALDFFGLHRRTVEGLAAQVDLQRYTLQAAYLTLTGNIVNALIARAAYQAEIKATEVALTHARALTRIAEDQFNAGTAPYNNVLTFQAQAATTEATLPAFRQKLFQAEALLAVLGGKFWESSLPDILLEDLGLPLLPLKAVPTENIRNRPDILQAEAVLHTSFAQVGVATAALYPSFSLSATYGLAGVQPGDLFKENSSFWNLGSNLLAPLFMGGTLRAQRDAAQEALEAALSNYRQVVLSAFSQVAVNLRALENDREIFNAQTNALDLAQKSLLLLEANYRAGTATYLQVLIANQQVDLAKINSLEIKALRLQDQVSLLIALGGGLTNTP